jgi:hypothetical protein
MVVSFRESSLVMIFKNREKAFQSLYGSKKLDRSARGKSRFLIMWYSVHDETDSYLYPFC